MVTTVPEAGACSVDMSMTGWSPAASSLIVSGTWANPPWTWPLWSAAHVGDRTGLDELHVDVRVQPGFLQGHAAGDVKSGARVGDGDRLTLEIGCRLDGRRRLHKVG